MRRRLLGAMSVALGALAGCPLGGTPDYVAYETDTEEPWVDFDDDGYSEDVDCDDEDAAVHPDADEVCDDGIDNDCDELVDGDDEECA